ncbi:MAG: hypothetical protein ACUVXC_17855, partial [Chloroflexus sp.]
QNQALSAILFLYREVLHHDLEPMNALRTQKPKVLSLSVLIFADDAKAAQDAPLRLWTLLPAVRIPMTIPVSKRPRQGFGECIHALTTPALERHSAYLLPPRRNHGQPAGVIRDTLHLYRRPCRSRQLRLPARMTAPVVLADQPALRRACRR